MPDVSTFIYSLSSAGTAEMAVAVIAVLVSVVVLPIAARKLLSRKYASLRDWWYSSAGKYQAKLEEDPGYSPVSADPGTDGALAIWRDDVISTLARGLLPKERYERAVEVGIVEANAEPELSESDVEAKYTRKIPVPAIACAGIAMGLVALFAACSGNWLSLSVLPFMLALWTLALCDQTSHVLPFVLCYAAYPLAVLYLVLSPSSPGPVAALWGTAATVIVVFAANAIFAFLGKPNAIGKGDMRLLPACALLLGGTLPYAIAICVMGLSMAAAALVSKVARHGDFGMDDVLPMGVYLAVGTTVGVLLAIALCAA